jgi:hypothetical protein
MSQLNNTSLNGNGNLLAHYVFNGGALTTDSSGNSRTLTNNNTVGETADGKYGYAADFGATNTNKNFSRSEDIWNNGAFSMVAWMKRSNTSDSHSPVQAAEADTDKQIYIVADATTVKAVIFRAGVDYDVVSADVTPDTNWHHYALTLTTGAGGTMKIYYDGVEKNSGTVTNASGTVGQADIYFVGGSSGIGGYVDGYVDDAAFFSDVLTPAEIAELASNPPLGIYTIL